jgi:Protein of unknown function (DUF3606)
MQDDLSDFKPLDPGRVNSLDPVELKYWCGQLACTERELLDAVDKVGSHIAEVRQQLATRPRHKP